MKLYIANCTAQHFDFAFRIPERTQAFKVHIRHGSQALVHPDLTKAEIDYVTMNAAVYGLVPIAEAERTPGFSGLAFTIDNPMSEDRIRRAMDTRTDVLVEIGRETRKLAGVGAHNLLEQHLDMHRGLASLQGLQSEIIDESPVTAADSVREEYHITRQADDPFAPNTAPKRGGRRGRAA